MFVLGCLCGSGREEANRENGWPREASVITVVYVILPRPLEARSLFRLRRSEDKETRLPYDLHPDTQEGLLVQAVEIFSVS